MAGVVVVFDFDRTIIDVDSDNWVIDGMGLTERFNELFHSTPWNCLMVGLLLPILAISFALLILIDFEVTP